MIDLLNRIKNFLQPLTKDGIILAFSGGTDSALLAAILNEMRNDNEFPWIIATANSVLLNPVEIESAKNFSRNLAKNVPHKIFELNPLSIEAVRNNRKDRCYHCKKSIFKTFLEYGAQNGYANIIDGTNADDTKVFRPGRKALEELCVISPFAILGITKKQIRELSSALNLPTAQKPASPCLATRFPYNTELQPKTIAMVAQAENILRQQLPNNANIRVRCSVSHSTSEHKICNAKIEVDTHYQASLQKNFNYIESNFKSIEFANVALDETGFSSGKFDV